MSSSFPNLSSIFLLSFAVLLASLYVLPVGAHDDDENKVPSTQAAVVSSSESPTSVNPLWIVIPIIVVLIIVAIGVLACLWYWLWRGDSKKGKNEEGKSVPLNADERNKPNKNDDPSAVVVTAVRKEPIPRKQLEKLPQSAVKVENDKESKPLPIADAKQSGDKKQDGKSKREIAKPVAKQDETGKKGNNAPSIVGNVQKTVAFGLGGVSVIRNDPSMRTLLKEVPTKPLPKMNRFAWGKAMDEIFEQQEQDEKVKPAKIVSKPVGKAPHVTVDMQNSIIYVVPCEFTQESETTQSSFMPGSSSMREPLFPTGQIASNSTPVGKDKK